METLTHVFIGCNQIVGKRKLYFRYLSALEVVGTADERITSRRLSQWRTESPKGFAFTMRALRAVTHPYEASDALPACLPPDTARHTLGLLQDTEGVRLAWAETLRLAQHLSPKVITLETPLAFTPSQTHRARLEWFAKELAPQAKATIAWQPHGLWDLEETVPWARGLGLVPIFDPFVEDKLPPHRGTGYFVIHEPRNSRGSFSEFDFEDLLDRLSPYQRVFLMCRGTDCYRDARLAYNTWKARKDAESVLDAEPDAWEELGDGGEDE
jgi:uncharacterized protein YecE (DUF72 family)